MLILVFGATATGAYYTCQQWITADDQERRYLRAYVQYDSGTISRSGDAYVANVTFKNTGLTPAYNLTSSLKVDIQKPIVTRDLQFLPEGGNFQETGIFTTDLGANQLTSPMKAEKTPSKEEIDALSTKQKYIYVWGVAKFRDIFNLCQRVAFLAQGDSSDGSMNVIWHSVSSINKTGDPCYGSPPKSTFPRAWTEPRL